MSTLLKAVAYSIGAWTIALALCFTLPLPVISGFAEPLSLLVGLVLFILALVSLVKDKHRILSLAMILLVVITCWLAITRAFGWGAWVHFQLNRGKYEGRLAEVLAASDDAERNKICGNECWLMSTNSNRVAFHYVHGFLNWQDFVYDATGDDAGFPQAETDKYMFGRS